MAYIGSIPAYQAAGVRPRDEFIGDGVQTCFALSQTVPGSFESNVTIIVDNVPQQPVDSFTIVDTKTLTLSGTTGTFVKNETVTGGTSAATARVIQVNPGNIVVLQLTGNFSNAEVVTGGTSGATATTTAVDTNQGGGVLFTEAPLVSSVIYVVHEGNATYNLVPAAGSVGPNQLSENLRNFTVDTFTGNGVLTAFTLSTEPATSNSVLVFVQGIMQTRTENYTVSGTTLTFTDPPDNGAAISVVHLGFSTVSRLVVPDGSITTAKLADNSVTSDKIAFDVIVANDIAANAITVAELQNGAVTPAKLSTGGPSWDTSSRLSVGTATPVSFALQTNQVDGTNGINTCFSAVGYGLAPSVNLRSAGGTVASPSATSVGPINFVGATTNDGINFLNTVSFVGGIESAPTAGSHPTFIAFNTTPVGSTTRVERLRITSAGNVGVGTDSPDKQFEVSGTSTSTTTVGVGISIENLSFSNNTRAGIVFRNGDNYNASIWSPRTGSSEGALVLATNNGSGIGETNIVERVRITSTGDVCIGTTTRYLNTLTVNGGISSTGHQQFNIASTNSTTAFEWVLRTGTEMQFYVNNASIFARLTSTGVWTNASDARYKENIRPITYGLDEVMQLQPRSYNVIGSDKQEIGFVAQEVQPFVPEVVESSTSSVSGEQRLTLSYGQLSAVLVKAIQEQQAMINEIKAEFAEYKRTHP